MKHVIGKRDGKTIVSGGGSLEEQRNNLKHWEVLDEESSPVKDQYNKRIKIDPQDVFLIKTHNFFDNDSWYNQICYTNTVIGELEEIPQPDLGTTTIHSKIKHDSGSTIEGNVLEEQASSIEVYKPIQDANGNWGFKVPVAKRTELLPEFKSYTDTEGKTDSVEFAIMIGCPFHYIETHDGEGNVTTKTIPNSSVEKCIKKYNIWQNFQGYTNYVKPENPTIVPFMYPLVYNAHYTALKLPVVVKEGNILMIEGNVDIQETDNEAFYNNIEAAPNSNSIFIGDDFIPYTEAGDNTILEFPKMYIDFITLF